MEDEGAHSSLGLRSTVKLPSVVYSVPGLRKTDLAIKALYSYT